MRQSEDKQTAIGAGRLWDLAKCLLITLASSNDQNSQIVLERQNSPPTHSLGRRTGQVYQIAARNINLQWGRRQRKQELVVRGICSSNLSSKGMQCVLADHHFPCLELSVGYVFLFLRLFSHVFFISKAHKTSLGQRSPIRRTNFPAGKRNANTSTSWWNLRLPCAPRGKG